MPARVFVAIELPGPAVDLLVSATEALTRRDTAWAGEKIVAPQLLHVTLSFFGRVPDDGFDPLVARLRLAAADRAPFELRLEAVRPVPSHDRASMVWATFTGDVTPAADLAAALWEAAGLPPDRRHFRPHVTLVRSRRPRHLRESASVAATTVLAAYGQEADGFVSVPSVTVFSSTLGRGQPVYEHLAILHLDGGAGVSESD